MKSQPLDFVFLGLTITSTWGNGHATTYRALLKEIARRGHRVTFLERDVPWYADNREFKEARYCSIELYGSLDELKDRFTNLVRRADAVVVGSYVPDGIAVGEWVTETARNLAVFYDIDTPVTLAALRNGECSYISRALYPRYDLCFSFTGGPTLDYIERVLGCPRAGALYCSVDPTLYYPEPHDSRWDLAYLGTYAADRQPALETLLLDVARKLPDNRFAVAGPAYPEDTNWPANVERIDHLPGAEHRTFYNSQKFALNLTRQDMVRAGYSPSVRLFEAAACGIPILTDAWRGLETFFEPHVEILPVHSAEDVTSYIRMPADARAAVGDGARRRTLRFHTAAVRAEQFETEILAAFERRNCLKHGQR